MSIKGLLDCFLVYPCSKNSHQFLGVGCYGFISPPKFDFRFQCSHSMFAVRNLPSQCRNAALKFDNTVIFHATFQSRIFNFTDFTPTISNMFNCHFMLGCHFLDILCLFHFLPPGTLEWLTVLTPCTLRAQSNMAETGYLQVHKAVNQMITTLKNITDLLEIGGLIKTRVPYSHAG